MRPRPSTAAALAALATSLAVTAPAASTAAEESGWVRVETEHFTFYSDAPAEAAVGVATDLERMRQALMQIAPSGRFESRVPIRLYLFADASGLAPFLPPPVGGADPDRGLAPGFLVPHEHGVYGAAQVGGGDGGASRYVSKQYLHWVLRTNLPELPLWFRQGLADLYSNLEITETEARIGLPIEEHIRYLRGGFRFDEIDLDRQVLRVTELPPGADAAASGRISGALSGHHPELWALVHFLAIGNETTRQQIPDYLQRLVAGEPPEAAFHAAFGTSRAELIEELGAYVRAESWRYARHSLANLGTVDLAALPLSPAETEYRLGDLLAHTGPTHPERAEAHFDRALELDPELGLAYAGKAWLARQQGRTGTALELYGQAVAKAPDDPFVHYLYGDALLSSLGRRRPETEEQATTLRAAVSALEKATALAPDYPEAWSRLGFALNLEPAGSQRAVQTLERAVALLPARPDVAVNLLLAYARTGDAAAADRLLASLPARGADAAALEQGREIRLQLDFVEANRLVRRGELDDAVAVLARIRAETRAAATAERARTQLEQVARSAQHRHFVTLFQEAAERIEAGDPQAAAALVALAAIVRPGRQTEVYEALVERLESRPSQAASSGEPKAAAAPR